MLTNEKLENFRGFFLFLWQGFFADFLYIYEAAMGRGVGAQRMNRGDGEKRKAVVHICFNMSEVCDI